MARVQCIFYTMSNFKSKAVNMYRELLGNGANSVYLSLRVHYNTKDRVGLMTINFDYNYYTVHNIKRRGWG